MTDPVLVTERWSWPEGHRLPLALTAVTVECLREKRGVVLVHPGDGLE
ncbi:MAG: hypothetical protein WCG47_15410 [Dermatophilaceae bacterium]